jgi:electron transport complex protein RnfG
MKHVIKPALSLLILAAAVTGLLGAVYMLTEGPIEEQLRKTQETAMRAVLPSADVFNQMDAVFPGNILAAHEGTRKDGEHVGYVVEVNPVGYSGRIHLMVGISGMDGFVTGMRVLRHTETPGLGSLITAERFYRQYEGKPLDALTVVRIPSGSINAIDAITSATISTQAVTDGVNEAIEWYVTGGWK